MAENGSAARYATLASKYKLITRIVPNASDSGTLRRGLTTSPAVKVILFHASAEKSEFVCATQIATNSPNPVAAVRPFPTSCNPPRKLQKSEKFAAPTPDRRTTTTLH